MVSVRDLHFSYGFNPILEGVYFSVPENYKVGLVGPNGAGKSTLLKIMSQLEKPDKGIVEVNGVIGYVPQEVKLDPDLESAETVLDYIDPTHSKTEFELKTILKGLELEHLSLDHLPKSLSGGQKTKLALARALILEPDILFLDEPTNFLDVAGKAWVMRFLSNYPKTLILISHDLDLLDKAIDKVLYLNPQTKQVEEYRGNYTKYLAEKTLREEQLVKKVSLEQRRIKHLEESVKKLTTDVKQRINLQNRIIRAKEKLPELPKQLKTIKVVIPTPTRGSGLPLQAIGIGKSYGDKKILDNVSISVVRGDKIALIGQNGAGKSTLLKIVVGVLTPDQGEVVRAEDTRIGYYSQEFENFEMGKSVIETASSIHPQSESMVRSVLGMFLISGEKIYQSVGSLSGGEKTRLSIALLLLQDFNLLILDEPTTYLDVTSQRIILEALKQYQGTLIIVSHTQEFIEELKPNKGLLLPDNIFDVWSDKFLNQVELT